MGINQTGDYSVALQVEDFVSPTDVVPLSSVPVQFIVRVMNTYANPTCTSQPVLVGSTPSDGSCLGVPFNTSWNATITARVPENTMSTYITDILTASPYGMNKSSINPSDNHGEWEVNVMWIPDQFQHGPNIFCYAALDNIGYALTVYHSYSYSLMH